ncbi:P-loop containing nucleoside triphosphate hydrolase protein [Rhizoctonia solani]|nr:P-loop containing nucleoside triphosphate hydrolase protein [Rhizoctonia solani]
MHESIATNLGLGSRIPSIFNTLSPHVRDGVNSIIIGSIFALTRKVFSTVWSWISRTFTATATFESGNEAYDWINEWLERQPNYSTSREFDVIAKPRPQAWLGTMNAMRASLSKVINRRGHRMRIPIMGAPPKPRPPINNGKFAQYMPLDFYGSSLLRVKRSRTSQSNPQSTDRIVIKLFTFSHTALQVLIEKAAHEYRARDLAQINIHIGDQYGSWKRLSSKPHRDLGSVVLDPAVKRLLLEDANDFLNNKGGTPGSGKSSSIHALASELRLDIYIVPLSLKAIDDAILANLISETPSRCILLYEDIDVAFVDRSDTPPVEGRGMRGEPVEKSGVTLSGLLNTIDGVQAQEGRLLFATTNHSERLDPALSRPVCSFISLLQAYILIFVAHKGRMDVKIEYSHSTQWQAEQLFRLFYPTGLEVQKESLDSHAKEFASAVPSQKLSVAQLQGYLMQYKGQPEQAAKEIGRWIEEVLTSLK